MILSSTSNSGRPGAMVAAALWAASLAAGAVRDPAFEEVHFRQLLDAGDTSLLKWSMSVPTPQLDPNQRLLGQLELKFDGADLEPRRGKGELQVFVQIEDSKGETYQDHGNIDLTQMQEGFRKYYLTYSQAFFVTPGQYNVTVLVLHTETRDHWSRRLSATVVPLKSDPLPGIWKGLPPIEFAPHSEPPDSYFLPDLKGELAAVSHAGGPLEVEILVNLSPSAREAGKLNVQQRNLGFLIPALKAICESLPADTAVTIDLLDLVRQKLAFHQEHGKAIDFEKMRPALVDDAGKIDLRALAKRNTQSSYFVDQIARRLAPSRVIIILSALFELEAGDVPVHLETALPPSAKVFYFRYAPPLPHNRNLPPQGRYSPRVRFIEPPPVDRLAPLLKSIKPWIYPVETPLQLRKAIAVMLTQIGLPVE